MNDDNTATDATTEVGDWGRYYGGTYATVRDVVIEHLGENGIEATESTVEAYAFCYRMAVNHAINSHGVYLRGDTFYAVVPAVDTSGDVIAQALEHTDLSGIAVVVDEGSTILGTGVCGDPAAGERR